jgi:hypothetical protein
MPNGGVPRHMILYPSDGANTVLHCDGGTLRIFDRAEWDARKAQGTPIATLSAADGAALAWHLRYWLGESRLQPGYNMPRSTVRAEYDF